MASNNGEYNRTKESRSDNFEKIYRWKTTYKAENTNDQTLSEYAEDEETIGDEYATQDDDITSATAGRVKNLAVAAARGGGGGGGGDGGSEVDSKLEEKRGRGTYKWKNDPLVESELGYDPQRNYKYSKRGLLLILENMKRHNTLKLSEDVVLPIGLKRNGVKIGFDELSSDLWIHMNMEDNTLRRIRKEDMRLYLENGEIKETDKVISYSCFQKNAIDIASILKMFEEEEDIRNINRLTDVYAKDENFNVTIGLSGLSEILGIEDSRLPILCYIDSYGNYQGPFSKEQILIWYIGGFLPDNLLFFLNEPNDIYIDNHNDNCRYVKIQHLITRWYRHCENWYYKDFSDTIQGPFNTDMMLEWFVNNLLPFDLKVKADCLFEEDINEFAPLIYYVVQWLPYSDRWILNEKNDDNILKEYDVSELRWIWREKYNDKHNVMYVRPSAWDAPDLFCPIEILLDAYGFVLLPATF